MFVVCEDAVLTYSEKLRPKKTRCIDPKLVFDMGTMIR